ncbi:type IIL restriction-modification enzyme MmeI [Corynebacterium striatum]
MTHVQRVSAARDFAARWKDRGAEKSDTQQFWIDLCSNVLGMEDQTTALHFESRTTGAGWIDVAVPRCEDVPRAEGIVAGWRTYRQAVQATARTER